MRGFIILVLVALVAFVVGQPTARAAHILVDSEEKALDLKKQCDDLKAAGGDHNAVGKKFMELAKEHSSCPSGAEGGSLGEFGKGAMVPEFDAVIFDPNSPLKEVLGPVQTQFGYHLIRIFKRDGMAEKEL